MRALLAAMFVSVTVTVTVTATANAQTCDRAPRDCVNEDAAFSRQVRELSRRHADVSQALEALRLRRLASCHDYNACGIEEAELNRVRLWSEGELTGLRGAAATDVGRSAWARSLAMRAALVAASSVQAATAVASRPVVTPQIRETIARMEADIQSYAALEPLLPTIERGIRSRRGRAPAVCSHDARRSLRAIVRAGGGAASYARTLRRELDDLCERFERHAEPDESLQNQMRRFTTRLTRIEGWMNEIRRCHDPGPYDGRCRNTYGDAHPDAMDQTRKALRMVRDVRRAIGNIPETPFPCGHAIWQRLEQSRWTLRTAQAQIPNVAREARSLCGRIGIEPSELETVTRSLRERIEQTRAQVVQQLRSRREGVARLRSTYGLDER